MLTGETIKGFSGKPVPQREDEFVPFLEFMKSKDVRSYLEIGARYGDSFYAVMTSLPIGSKGVCVDLPEAAFGKVGSAIYLEEACDDLHKRGYDISLIMNDSADLAVIEAVRKLGPYDMILIDADHEYKAVKMDFLAYSDMGKFVAFHDIDNAAIAPKRRNLIGVPRLWNEIKSQAVNSGTDGYIREFISADRTVGKGMGIGVLGRD